MRTIFLTGAATAALLGVSAAFAAAPGEPASDAPNPPSTFEHAALSGASNSVVSFTTYSGDYLRASDLLHAGVYHDDRLGSRIDDIALDDDGQIESVIVKVGAFLGLGGDETSLAPLKVDFARTDSGVRAVTSMTREEIHDAASAMPGRNVDLRPSTDPSITGWSLEALIEAGVDSQDMQNAAAIDDILFDNNGRAEYVILRTGGSTGLNGRISVGGKLTTVDYSDLELSVVDNDLDVNIAKTAAEVADRPSLDFSPAS